VNTQLFNQESILGKKQSKITNSPDEIEATPLSVLAIKFKNTTNPRERDALFLKIAEHYMPKIKKELTNVQNFNQSEFIQLYYIEVYSALLAWKMKSNFETYLYMYVKAVYRKFMNNIKLFKKGIDCKYISQLNPWEEPSNETDFTQTLREYDPSDYTNKPITDDEGEE